MANQRECFSNTDKKYIMVASAVHGRLSFLVSVSRKHTVGHHALVITSFPLQIHSY